jgi:hypothetical protein
MEQQDANWQIIPAPQRCETAGKPKMQICTEQLTTKSNDVFEPTGSNTYVRIPAIEMDWNSAHANTERDIVLPQDDEFVSAPGQAANVKMECTGEPPDVTTLTLNPSNILTASIPPTCKLKMSDLAGKLIKEIIPRAAQHVAGHSGLPSIIPFKNGELTNTAAAVTTQLQDILITEVMDKWPIYAGCAAGIIAGILTVCYIMTCCFTRPTTGSLTPMQPLERRQKKQPFRRTVYVRPLLPSPPGN